MIKFRFQQLEYYYKREFFSKSDEFSRIFHSILLSQELIAISIHICDRDRSHESWPEARRASGIVSRAKLISRMKTRENRIENSMA